MKIGDSIVKITKFATGDIDTIVDKILSLTNVSQFVRQKRVERLKQIHANAGQRSVANSKSLIKVKGAGDQSSPLLKEYVIKNTLGIVSKIPEYTDKVFCVLFLISKNLHIAYRNIFRLDENLETQYEYINSDNKKINLILGNITREIAESSASIDALIAQYKKDAGPEISSAIFDVFTERELLTSKTGNFYKHLRRRMGEMFKISDQERLAQFLKDYRKERQLLTDGSFQKYCNMFNVSERDYNKGVQDSVRFLSVLSSEDLFIITEKAD